MQKHVFQIEKLRKVTLYGVLLLLILIFALILLFQTSYIQTKITHFITKELSEKFNSKITIKSVKISLFRGFVFNKVFVEDQQQDTLLYINKLSIIPSGLQIDISDLSLKEIEVNGLFLNIYNAGKDTLNIQYIVDIFNSKNNKKEDFKIKLQEFIITNSRFSFNISDTIVKNQIDFKNLKLDSINLNLGKIEIINDDIVSEIKSFSFKDVGGFIVDKLSSEKIHINPKKAYLKSLTIKTPVSNLMFDSLNVNYPANYNLSKYKTELKSNISIKRKSYVSYSDIMFFIPDTNIYNAKIMVSGNVSGNYDNFSISNLSILQDGVFSLNINSKIKGLNAFIDPIVFVKVKKFSVNLQKIKETNFPYNEKLIEKIPNWLRVSNIINYSGITKGKFSEFETKGRVYGDFGEISLNAEAIKDTSKFYRINGKISAKELKFSNVIKNKDIGELTFSQTFKFLISKKRMKIKTSGIINELYYKKYLYKNIDLYSELSNNKIDSINILIDQPHLSVRILGNLDFSHKIPKIELFANVANADLFALNLLKTKEKISHVKFIADAKFEGYNLNDFFGSIKLKKALTYKSDTSIITIKNFDLTSKRIKTPNEEKVISLKSDIVDVKLITYKNPDKTIQHLKDLKNRILETYSKENRIIKDTSIFGDPIKIEAEIKKANIFMSFFKPEYHISDNTKIYGFYNPKKNKINLSLNSKFLKYKNFYVKDFYIIAYTKGDKIYGGLGGSSAKPNKHIFVENVSLEGDFSNDSINFNLNWDNLKDSAHYSASILGKIKIKTKENKKRYYDCVLNNSHIIVNDVFWKFNDARIVIDSTKISIFDLRLRNFKQKLYLDGNISDYSGDILFAEYENFKISNIQPLIKNNISINGELSGSTTFAQLYDKPLIFTTDSIVNLNINKIDFGNFYFKSNWDNKENKIHANAYNLKGKYKKFMNDTIYGDYWPNTGNINFVTDVRSMLVKTFKDYYFDYAKFNSTAFINGKFVLYGNYKKPQLKGNLKLKQASVLIKYLNTNYAINDMDVYFDNNNISLSKTQIFSENTGGEAFIKGNISHKLFSNYNLDVDIDANNLQIMNLGRTKNSYFYGTAYGTGNLNFSGPFNNIYLDANLKTEKNTFVFIPMSSSETLKDEQNFIRFVSDTTVKDVSENNKEYSADLNGFTMNILIDVSPEATIQILPDDSGDIITNGSGSLNLKLDSESNFNMFGTYVISKGNYTINIGNITKTFQIENGSKIKWGGEPKGALVDIIAKYSLDNVNLNNLLPNDVSEIEKSDVDCLVSLAGTILDPSLKLNIILPDNVSQKYKSKLASFEEKDFNEQFLSLLIMQRFFSNIGTDFADSRPITGDLLTSQLNNMLNKLSKDFDMTVVYKPGQETITDKYGVKLSGKAFDNRLSYVGGVGIGGNEIEKKDEAIVGEAEIEYKLDRKGNFKAKFYNKANDHLENDGTYTQGLGLIWRQKFDNFFWWKQKKYLNDTTYQNKRNEK